MLIKLLLSLALVIALGMTWRRKRQQAITRFESLAWSVLWIGAAVVVWWPGLTTRVANVVGIGRGADLVLYAAVFGAFVLVFQLHVAHHRLERQLTELVQREALKEVSRNNDQVTRSDEKGLEAEQS